MIGIILGFLQLGMGMNLALSTIKGQMSALAVFFYRPIAAHLLVYTFVQGVTRLVPTVKSPLCPWDLN